MGRRIVGNLDAEKDLGLLTVGDRLHRRQALSRAALGAASALATLLRVFAGEGDRLWTPEPVDPERLPDVPGVPRPVLESGPLAGLPAADGLLAWAETPAVAAMRSSAGVLPPTPAGRRSGPLHETLWQLAPPVPAVVARVHHRAFALDTARRLGLALPGACLIASVEEVEGHLAAGGAAASPTGGWVVKAPLSAAGRDRYVQPGTPKVPGTTPKPSTKVSGTFPENVPDTQPKVPDTASPAALKAPDTLSPAVRRRLERLLERHGALVFEPWMERSEDFGLAAVLGPEGLRVVGFHRLLVDLHGGFAGIELDTRFRHLEAALEGAPEEEVGLWRRSLEEVGAALAEAGYRGPFGIDGYRHREIDGTVRLHPLGEINARMTFGLVARCLADRVGAALGWPAAARVRLTVGRRAPEGTSIALLHPGADGSPGAWLVA